MNWEPIERQVGGRTQRPQGWSEFPCVSVCKTTFTFNESFCKCFGIERASRIYVLYSDDPRCIGFKVAQPDDPSYEIAFAVQCGEHKKEEKRRHKTASVTCKRLLHRVADCQGRVYRAHKVNNGVIEVQLHPNNQIT